VAFTGEDHVFLLLGCECFSSILPANNYEPFPVMNSGHFKHTISTALNQCLMVTTATLLVPSATLPVILIMPVSNLKKAFALRWKEQH